VQKYVTELCKRASVIPYSPCVGVEDLKEKTYITISYRSFKTISLSAVATVSLYQKSVRNIGNVWAVGSEIDRVALSK
jgi:hypothetical protein